MRDDGEVVADEDVGEAALAPQRGEEVQDLGLHRDVERRGRLVEEQDRAARGSARGRSRRAGAGRPRAGAGSGSGSAGPSPTSASAARAMRGVARRRCRGWRAARRRVRSTVWRGMQRAVGVLEDHLHAAGEGLVAAARHRLRRRRRSRPPATGARPQMARSTVDLPEPDSPTRPKAPPRATAKRDVAHGVRPGARPCRRSTREVVDLDRGAMRLRRPGRRRGRGPAAGGGRPSMRRQAASRPRV